MSTRATPAPTAEQEAVFARIILDPALFAEEMLQTIPWQIQAEILQSVATKPKTAVKACHSSGKTKIAAVATLWWLARYEESIVVTTSASQLQVEKILWSEIHGLLAKSRYKFPPALLTELKVNSRRFATGFSTSVTQKDQGVKFQGFHSPHLLIIVDEAIGIPPEIFSAIEGARAGGHVSLLVIGNPTIGGSGPFFDCFNVNRASYNCITISAFDTPNLEGLTLDTLLALSEAELDYNRLPYLTTRRWVKERYDEWGLDSPLFQSRVLGCFPTNSENSLLDLAWLEAAKDSTAASPKAKVRVGIDVAGPGSDSTVLVARRGCRILEVLSWATPDARGEIVAVLRKYENAGDLESVNVDSIGIGWGMFTHLSEWFPAVAVNVGESARDSEKHANLKAELYWALRLRFQARDVSGLDDATISQLAGLRYNHDPRGRIVIESKTDARKRGVKSPDRAEAIMLAFAELGAGSAIYARAFTDDLIYDPTSMPIGFGNVGSYEERVVSIAFGAAKPMVFLEIADTGALIYVTREYFVDGAKSTQPKTDTAYADDLEKFVAGENAVTGEKVLRSRPLDATIILSDAAENFASELSSRNMYRISANEDCLQAVQVVGSLLERKMIRISSACVNTIREHRSLTWDRQQLALGIEIPQATNGQTCEALRFYARTRLGPWRLVE